MMSRSRTSTRAVRPWTPATRVALLSISIVALCLLVTGAVLGAVADAGTGGAPVSAGDVYRVSPGDTLSIVVTGDELFTRDCPVSGAGTISYPQLGDIAVAGLTTAELKTNLEKSLAKYLKYPQVSVTVRQYGQSGMSVFVMGEVRNPGAYPLSGGAGYMQALAAAGGLSETASGEITLVKARTRQSFTFQLGEAISGANAVVVEPGDVLLALRKREARYAVLGEVPRPGMFEMPVKGEVRVLDALEKCGLLTPTTADSQAGTRPDLLENPNRTADLEHAELSRGGVISKVNVAALLRGDTSQNVALESGDTLTIPRRQMLRVYATGEVRNPGRVNLPLQATVLDALTAAGGLTTSARPSQAKVVRQKAGKLEPISVDISEILGKADSKQNLVLQEGDVLFIPPRGDQRPAWRDLLSILPFV